MSISIDIQGINQLAAKIAGIDIDDISRRLLKSAAIEGENQGKIHAPVDESRLRTSVTHKADSARVASFGTNVFYGAILDKPKERDPHYRRGPFAGQSTEGWLSDRKEDVQHYIDAVLIPNEIRNLESSW